MKNVTTLVLGGGRGTRLYPLTKYRSKPAVPLAAKYRLIDIPLSNCINSGMNRIYVLTQFMSVSLHRHIRQTYRFDAFNGGFVEILAAQQTMETGTNWYEGTADAVRKNMKYFDQPGIDYVLILSGDQLYRMDYRDMIKTHQQSGADVTIAALPVSRKEAGSLGVMRIDDTGRVAGFLEKPQTDDEINLVRTEPAWIDARGIESKGRECLASMGIYLFDRKFLVDVLTKTDYQDFGKEVFPAAFRSRHVQAHLYDDYWEDIGTIKAYFDSTLGLASFNSPFDFYEPDAPIYSRARFLPPTILDGATVNESMIADGCKIGKGAVIENSVIGLRCQIGENVTIRNSIVMGADFYETEGQRNGRTAVGIGKGSVMEGAILDKNCRVGQNVRIVNEAGIENGEDAEDCVIRDQIPIVIKEATLPDGWKL
ncbi:MAG TPA: glucose-1-phosphate adenylyltransferase [Pirellulaceae bacterium]|nr:glucose-1-phosphate adenylyltransferase [Pirellulaceae bacterium]